MRTRLVGLVVAVASGCASVGNVQRADTVGKGNYQIGIEPGVQAITTAIGTVPYPHVDGSFRYGVTDGVDVGARIGQTFLELQGKFLITKPGAPGLIVSIAPTVGGLFFVDIGLLNFAIPALIGIPFGQHELVLGPRVQGAFAFVGSAGGALVLAPGATVGFAFQVNDTFAVMPELGAIVPVLGSVSAISGGTVSGAGFGGMQWQLKLGLLIGKRRKLSEEDLPPPPPPPGSEEPPPLPVR